LAQKRLGNGGVTVSFFGDGAANEGAVHEAMNIAAIWDLPLIFVCENNLYAASTSFATAFRIDDVAARAGAYGMPGIVVDGNDVMAVHEAAGAAIARARDGGGATLMECKTYRLCGHSRSDPLTYRPKEEEARWREREPIGRLAAQMRDQDLVTEARLQEIEEEVVAVIDGAVAFAEASPDPLPTDALQHVFYGQEA